MQTFLEAQRARMRDARQQRNSLSIWAAVLEPGQAVFTKRTFDLPIDARGIAVVIGDGSFGACPMIAECSTSHDASQYVIATGVYRKGSSFLALVQNLKREARTKPPSWR